MNHTQPQTTAPHPAFIRYPAQAAFGQTLPKSKIYAHSHANTRLKELFVQQVEHIVWAYKLAAETLHIPARADVVEIQIFQITLKTPALHHDVLRCIDGAIPFPILFELNVAGSMQIIAAYKRRHATDPSRQTLSDYFASDWLPADSARAALPVALHMAGLYAQLLQRLIPLPARAQESLAELVMRAEQVQAKQRELNQTTARLAKEKQFKRKVDINAHRRQLQAELDALLR